MRPSGRSRGSVPGRRNVTTLNRIVSLSTPVAGEQCIDPPRQPTAEWLSCLRVGTSRASLPPTRRISGGSERGRRESAGVGPELVAGNGLLDRRALLAAGAFLGSAAAI